MENAEQNFDFGPELQAKILSMMIFNTKFLIQASKYVEPYYFTSDAMQWLCKQVLEYYEKYRMPISESVLVNMIRKAPADQQMQLVAVAKQLFDMKTTENRYLKDALKEFVQRNVFMRQWMNIARAYNSNEHQEAYKRFSEAAHVIQQVDFTPPDRTYFFNDYHERAMRRTSVAMGLTSDVFPIGIKDLDAHMQGGLRRGELGMFFGDAKIGKSIGLIHAGFACVRPRYGRVLHFILEGSREMAEDRYDARFAEFNYYALRKNRIDPNLDLTLRHEYKNLEDWMVLEGLSDKWDYTVQDLEGRMHELEADGFVADMLVVDYGDLLMPRKEADKEYSAQRQVFQDLKTLAVKSYGGRGVAIWTASQIQRPRRQGSKGAAHPADIDPDFVWTASELADSYAKIRIADIGISLNQTIQEREDGYMRLHISHARDVVGKATFSVRCDFSRMIFHSGKVDFVPQTNKQFEEQHPWRE